MSGRSGNPFIARIRDARPLLIDGGLATQLEADGCNLDSELWSARLLADAPERIVAAHQAFLEAGAELVTSASYQASRRGFAGIGIGSDGADELLALSVQLARRAARESVPGTSANAPLVAASIGPYGAILHDGSEYRGDYAVPTDALAAFHDARLDVLVAAEPDVLAVETLPSYDEAAVLARLLADQPLPAWVAFSCRDAAHISDGTPLADAALLFRDHPTVVAVGINCTAPQHAPALIRRLRQVVPDKVTIAYPNSGAAWQADTGRWHGRDSGLHVTDWLRAGATILGGCCRVMPADIAAMRASIDAYGLHDPKVK